MYSKQISKVRRKYEEKFPFEKQSDMTEKLGSAGLVCYLTNTQIQIQQSNSVVTSKIRLEPGTIMRLHISQMNSETINKIDSYSDRSYEQYQLSPGPFRVTSSGAYQ